MCRQLNIPVLHSDLNGIQTSPTPPSKRSSFVNVSGASRRTRDPRPTPSSPTPPFLEQIVVLDSPLFRSRSRHVVPLDCVKTTTFLWNLKTFSFWRDDSSVVETPDPDLQGNGDTTFSCLTFRSNSIWI